MDARNTTVRRIRLKPEKLDAKNFEAYGQIISSEKDGAVYGPDDAQLELSRGVPRFYIMNLKNREHLTFGDITHHAKVTQCLGSIGGHTWYLGVASASVIEPGQIESHGRTVVQSSWGHYYLQPSPDDVRVFRVDGPRFLKLHVGTWHAGPFFKGDSMDFYNLELSDTNVSFAEPSLAQLSVNSSRYNSASKTAFYPVLTGCDQNLDAGTRQSLIFHGGCEHISERFSIRSLIH